MNKSSTLHNTYKAKTSQGNEIRTSKLGYQFIIDDTKWRLNNHTVVNWSKVPIASENKELLTGFKRTVANYGEQVSPAHTVNMFEMMNRLIPFCTEGEVTVKAINEWQSILGHEHLWYLGNLRGFLLQWADWGHSGIEQKVPAYLDSLRLPGNAKGRAVRISCPYSGPFDPQEYQALSRWVQSAWRNQEVTLSDCALLRFFMETGRRPSEAAALRIADLRVKALTSGPTGVSKDIYGVIVHRSKRRGKNIWRDQSAADELPISDDLYDLLHNLGQQTILCIERLWGVKLSPGICKELPLFVAPAMTPFKKVKATEEFEAVIAHTPDFFHTSRVGIHSRLVAMGKACTAISSRTNDYMLLSAYRFRRTLGSVLAKNGYNAFEIAAALGHDDIQNVQVYTENSAEAFDGFEEIMKQAFEPIVKAFTGEIIGPNHPDTDRQPYVHVLSSLDAPVEAGKCGSFAHCHRGWYMCYTCVKFRAFIDADHQRALKEVSAEYERTKSGGYQDSMLTGLEATMDAIKEVIRLCDQKRGEVVCV